MPGLLDILQAINGGGAGQRPPLGSPHVNPLEELLKRVRAQVPQGGRTPGFNPEAGGGGQVPAAATSMAASMAGSSPALSAVNPESGSPDDPFEAQIAALESQRQKLAAQAAAYSQPDFIQQQVLKEVGDFDTFRNKQFEEKYGGKGVKNTAGRMLLDFLGGMKNGQTLREATNAKSEADYRKAQEAAVVKQQAQAQAVKTQMDTLTQQSTTLRGLQQFRNEQLRMAQAQKRIDVSEGNLDIRAQQEKRLSTTARSFGGVTKGQQLIDTGIKTVQGTAVDPKGDYRALMNFSGEITGALPLKAEEASRVFEDWAMDSDGDWGKIIYTGDGDVKSFMRLPPPPELAGRVSASTNFRSMTRADGSTFLVPVTETTVTKPAVAAQPTVTAPPSAGTVPLQASPQASSPQVARPAAAVGVPVDIPGAARPQTATERQQFQRSNEGLLAIANMQDILEKDPKAPMLASIPVYGKTTEFYTNRALAADAVTRIMTGAALNNQEIAFYNEQFPTIQDTIFNPANAKLKLALYENFLEATSSKKPDMQKRFETLDRLVTLSGGGANLKRRVETLKSEIRAVETNAVTNTTPTSPKTADEFLKNLGIQ